MIESLADLFSVMALSMFKFFFAPFLGAEEGLHFFSTFWACIVGMNLSVVVFSFFGDSIKGFVVKWFYSKNRKKFTPTNRRIVSIWKKYGLLGLALLTPPLLTPPVGTLVATGFGVEKKKIFFYMFVSSILWGLLLCYTSYALKEEMELIKEFFRSSFVLLPH